MSPNSWFQQAVYIPSGNPETMNEPTLDKGGQLGVRFAYTIPSRSVPSGSTGAGTAKAYKMVRSDSSMSVAPYSGAVAWFANQATYLVTTVVTALGRGRVAGIFRTNVTPGNYCCVQVKGLGVVKLTDASIDGTAAGLFVQPSATNGKAEVLAAGAENDYPLIGRTAGMANIAARECLVDIDIADVL